MKADGEAAILATGYRCWHFKFAIARYSELTLSCVPSHQCRLKEGLSLSEDEIVASRESHFNPPKQRTYPPLLHFTRASVVGYSTPASAA